MTQTVEIIELRQKRCGLRYGEGPFEPDQTPDGTYAQDDTILSSALDRTASVYAAFDVTFGAAPDGVIWEQGAAAIGSYLGVTNGELVFRAGDGSADGTNQTAMIRRAAADLAGGTYTIVAQVVMPATVKLHIINAAGSIIYTRTSSATSGAFPSGEWSGGNDGAIGRVESLVVAGESTAGWNSTIAEARFYEGNFFPGCFATGSIKCLQTFPTCDFKAAYNLNGELRWFFHRAGDPAPYTADLPSANEWHGPSLPILQSVSTEESRINLGATREGEKPFGLRGKINISLADFEFRNQFGDFYADEREIKGSIGALLLAWLGDSAPQMELYWYRGVKGQTLAEMDQRRFDLINIDPPANGRWTIEGMDPLHRALRGKAQFPRATDIRLVGDIDASTTDITVFGAEIDVSDSFGNTATSYARIGSEIIGYTGYTGSAGEWTLLGVTRGALETVVSEHNDNAGVQRVGHYQDLQYYAIVYDILSNHTTIPDALIPYTTQWLPEGRTYLGTLRGTGTFIEPREVDQVCGFAMRDGLFSLWWDALDQQIKIKALRQPREVPRLLNEAQHLVDVQIVRRPQDRITRVVTYYGRGNPTIGLDEATNYDAVRIRIDAEAEGAEFADGTIRARTTYSALLRSDANAVLAQALQLQRYKETPQYISFRVDRKDSDIAIGDVVQIESAKYIDRLGNPEVTTWEVIQGPKDIERGAVYEYMAQSFVLFDRPAFIMANDAPTFADATDAEKFNACYIAENTGVMPDGSPAYVFQ